MKPLIAFDESGNTGANLFDPEQPVFVLASVDLSDANTALLTKVETGELKFSKLRKSKSGQARVLELLNSPLLFEDSFLISAFHKPFVAVTKIVDLLIEPMMYDFGIDLYERGGNLAMANMLYFSTPVIIGKDRFNNLTKLFVQMVRIPSLESVGVFYNALRDIYLKFREDNFAQILEMLLATKPVALAYINNWQPNDLDPAIPAFVQQGASWTARHIDGFSIVHDPSKPIIQEQVILEAMMSATDPQVMIGYDRRKMVFPIKADGIGFRNSSTFPQLQIADILSGSAAYVLKAAATGVQDDFSRRLLATKALSGTFQPVWPEPKVTPAELGTDDVGGIDPNNHIGAYIARRLGGIPAKGKHKKT